MVFEEYTLGKYYVVKLRIDTSQPEEIEKVRDHLLALCDQGKRFLAIDYRDRLRRSPETKLFPKATFAGRIPSSSRTA